MKMLGAPANRNKNGLTATVTVIYFPDKKLLRPSQQLRPINTPAGFEFVCGVNPFRLLYCWCDIAFWLRWSYLIVFIYSVLILGHPGCPQPRELACFLFPAVGHNLGLFMEWLYWPDGKGKQSELPENECRLYVATMKVLGIWHSSRLLFS